jgi:hypothetical protein
MSMDKKDGGPDEVAQMDLDALEAVAIGSDEKEAYHSVSSGGGSRLGVVVSVSPDGCCTYMIELLVNALADRGELQVSDMERAAGLSKRLKGLGYSMCHEEDGWLSFERVLQRGEVEEQCRVLTGVLTAYEAGAQEPGGEDPKEG